MTGIRRTPDATYTDNFKTLNILIDSSWLIITILALIFSALFSGIEIAFVTSDRVRVELDVQKGGLVGRALNTFFSNSEFFISTILRCTFIFAEHPESISGCFLSCLTLILLFYHERFCSAMSFLHYRPQAFCKLLFSVLGAPLFRKATLHFENGKSLTIDAPDNSPENMYIESLKVNGVDYSRNYLTHGNLQNGGTLRFDMGSQPNMKRGTQPEDYPYSFSNELKK